MLFPFRVQNSVHIYECIESVFNAENACNSENVLTINARASASTCAGGAIV